MKKVYFTPGPAELFPTVEKHIQTALAEQIGSISHRSQKFRDIYKFTVTQLRMLMNIPESHAIFFMSSATEIWERLVMNCVAWESFHLVNGSFSRKFYEFSVELRKHAHLFEKPLGEGFSYEDFENQLDKKRTTNKVLSRGGVQFTDESAVKIPEYAELVALTHNETSSGVQMSPTDMHQLKRSYRDKLFCVDMVSSAPYPDLDFDLIDCAYFSVQKSFGLPAGLGVWIVNEKCLQKANQLRNNKDHEHLIGTYHSLPSLWKNYEKWETPETPNVWNIYLLGKIAEDMNDHGIDLLRKETELKAKKLYEFADKSDAFDIFVKNPVHRSQTVVVLNTQGPAAEVIEALKQKNMVVGSGYGSLKPNQIRIANFPAVSVEQVETLIDEMKKL